MIFLSAAIEMGFSIISRNQVICFMSQKMFAMHLDAFFFCFGFFFFFFFFFLLAFLVFFFFFSDKTMLPKSEGPTSVKRIKLPQLKVGHNIMN